jgi:energy-coupling factor transporter ATP-binding protein EcfA2
VTTRKRPKKAPLSPTGGYFASITVRGIRCFGPEQTLKLLDRQGNPARWTVLLGDNGVGKTTLLQALAMVAPVNTPDFVEEQKTSGLRPGTASLIEQLESTPVVQDHVAFRLFSMNMIRGEPNVVITGELHYKATIESIERRETSSSIKFDGEDMVHIIPSLSAFYVGYGASRRIGAGSLDVAKDNPFTSLFDDDAPLRDAEEWLIFADYAAKKESSSTKKVRAEADMAWMIDLAARMFEAYPDSKNPLAEPAVVLVDEIDLHLHPKWQRELLAHLTERFPQTQFIAAAHSPLVVQAAPDANVVVLRRQGDHVVIDQ